MEAMNDLKALFQHEIKDLISAEDQIIEALPMMSSRAANPALKKALDTHLEITRKQRQRLDRVLEIVNGGEEQEQNTGLFAGLFQAFQGEQKCKGIEGIITEGQKIMTQEMTPEVMDAAIVAAAQKVEHYEICGYGTVRAYAQQLNLTEAARLLEETLNEEYEADDLLTGLALGGVNERAKRGGGNRQGASRSASDGKTPMKKTAKKAAAKTPAKTASKKAPAKKSAAPAKKTAAPKKAAAPAKKTAAKKAASKKTAAKKRR